MTIALNTKILEVKIKIPNITNLANTAAPTAVENKTPNVVNLVKKTDYNTKLVKLKKKKKNNAEPDHDKYTTAEEFNKSTSENFAARLAQANVANKSDIANFIKKTDFHDKLKNLNKNVTSNKNELNELSEKNKAILT